MAKKLAVFDIEIKPNFFLCCVKEVGKQIETFEISSRRNDVMALADCFLNRGYIMAGYNCSHYDTPIMNMILENKYKYAYAYYLDVTDECYQLSKTILDKSQVFVWKEWKWKKFFPQIDLMTLMASQALRVGLKSLQVTMCYPNVKEMIVDWDQFASKEEMDNIIRYCHNDVDSTSELLKLLKSDLQLRIAVKREFDIECLSKDGVGVGVDLFTKYICTELGTNAKGLYKFVDVDRVIAVRDFILPDIKFKSDKFKGLLDWFKSRVVDLDEWEAMTDEERKKDTRYKKTVIFNKLAHSYGLGGLHSVNKPAIFEADDEYYLSDRDVASYYPALCISKGFGPRGMLKAFISVMTRIRTERLIAKKGRDKVKDTAFKLAMNSILGNLKNKYSPFYDPSANMAIAINGQLYLSMLIEEAELAGIECVSSNTDGATFKVRRKDKQMWDDMCTNWEKKTEMILEEALYEKMVIVAVNDYIAFKEGYSKVKDRIQFYTPEESVHFNFVELKLIDDEVNNLRNNYVKEKGMFITVPRLTKGLDSLIVPKALQNYFGKGIPVEDTIRDYKSIHDYIKMEKVGRQFNVEYNHEEQQHINRFYVSKGKPYLMKWKMKEKKVGKIVQRDKITGEIMMEKSYSNLLAGKGVALANDLSDINEQYDIDFQYYISEANKIIEKIIPSQTTLF